MPWSPIDLSLIRKMITTPSGAKYNMAWTVPASTDVLMTGCALFRCDGDQEALSVYALGYAIVSRSNSSRGNEMTTQSSHTSPILVTGAAGAVGTIGRNVTEMLLAKGHKVRALPGG